MNKVGKRSAVYDKAKTVEAVLRGLNLERDWLRERLRKHFTTNELQIVRDALAALNAKATAMKWQKRWSRKTNKE